jgi:hypothetical protein
LDNRNRLKGEYHNWDGSVYCDDFHFVTGKPFAFSKTTIKTGSAIQIDEEWKTLAIYFSIEVNPKLTEKDWAVPN